MNNKGISTLVLILTVLLFGAAVAAAYFYGKSSTAVQQTNIAIPSTTTIQTSPTPASSSAQLKTYMNDTYKYSIEYPFDWVITNLTTQTPYEKALDFQLLNGIEWNCVEETCIEIVLRQNLNLERLKQGSGDAGMASSAEASTKEINGKEYTMVIRGFSALNNQTGQWEDDPEKSYFVYIPHKGNYLQIRGNLKMKENIDQIAASYYEYP